MRTPAIVLSALLPLLALAGGCADRNREADRLPPPVPSATPTSNTTAPDATVRDGNRPPAAGRATSVPPDPEKDPNASTGAGVPPAPEKDNRRGNTPPGMDRSGGGPADGAIRDPAGVVTKQPEPKTPVQ
jgi:hypothetical protein